jgi:hypothetical protein
MVEECDSIPIPVCAVGFQEKWFKISRDKAELGAAWRELL